jgi:polar amino acid transport system substrate-binding protein
MIQTNNRNIVSTVYQWLGASALCLLLSSAHGAPLTVQILAQETIPPKWVLDDGKPRGLCPDILAAIERIEPGVHFTGYDSGRSLLMIEAGMESGRVDAACALLDSPRRESVGQIVGASLYSVRHRLVGLITDRAVINSIDDLARMKVLVNTARGSAYILQLKEHGIEIDDDTGDARVNLRKILAGHGRYTYLNELTLQHYLRSEHLESKLKMLPVVLREEPVFFFVSRKADPALAPMLDAALLKLKTSGELARIYERWSK